MDLGGKQLYGLCMEEDPTPSHEPLQVTHTTKLKSLCSLPGILRKFCMRDAEMFILQSALHAVYSWCSISAHIDYKGW